jgi:PAS domain S-box-containing protein
MEINDMTDNLEIKLLLVEDNRGDARLIQEMLKDNRLARHACTVAENLTIAVSRMENQEFDIIILDLNLPESGGIETLDRIMGLPGIMPPIIVLTGLDDEDIGLSAIERGAEDFLVKNTINAVQLSRSIRYAIERNRMENQRKSAIKALQENEARLSMALEVGDAGVWEWDLINDTVRFDDRFHVMLGYTPGELPNTLDEWMSYHHPDDIPVWMPKAEAYISGENPQYESEHRIRDKGGSWVWVFTRGKIMKTTPAGVPELFIGIAMNITERKRAGEVLRESQDRYQALAEAAHDMIFIINLDGFVEYVNAFAASQLHCRPEEIIGKRLEDLFPLERTEHQRANLLMVSKTLEPFYIENEGIFTDGSLWIGTWLVPLKNAQGEVRSVLGISRDISKIKQTEKKLQNQLDELRRWQEVMIDREGRMIELKKEVNSLLRELGKTEKYDD